MQDSDSEKEIEQDLDDGVHNQQVTEKNFERTPDILLRPRKSRFRDADSPDPHTHADRSPTTSNATIPTPKRTREEILQDVVIIIPIIFIVNSSQILHILQICFGIDVKGAEIVDRNPSGGNERRNRCYMQRGLEPRTCQRYPRYTRYN